MILNKAFDLFEKNPKHFNNYRKLAQGISLLKDKWKEKMTAMEEEAFSDKEKINMHIESIKYKDLEFLKRVGGPFTTAEEVQRYVNETEESKNRNKMLYVEVGYVKNTSLRLKLTDPVFRLKRDNENLYTTEYAENLIKYLGTALKSGNITMNDFSDAIKKTTGNFVENQEKSLVEPCDYLVKPSEHVAIFRIEKTNEVVWYFGIVNEISENNE